MLVMSGKGYAFTTDSYVVKPYFFPGGDIGKLAVCGTVNDLAVQGAQPFWLSLGFILEEGLPLADLQTDRRVHPRRRRARPACRSSPATPRWSSAANAKGLYINTAGLGPRRDAELAGARPT